MLGGNKKKATCTFHNAGAIYNSRNTMYQTASVVSDQQTNQVFFKMIHPSFVLDNKNHGRFGQTQQFAYSISTQ
jgi:hypothetical protein